MQDHTAILCLLLLFGFYSTSVATITTSWNGVQYEAVVVNFDLPYEPPIYTGCTSSQAPNYVSCKGKGGSGKNVSDPLCFDSDLPVSSSPSQGNATTVWIRADVEDYLSCNDSVVVSVKLVASFGVQSMVVYAGGTNFSRSVLDVTRITDGVTPFLFCCEELTANGWDGSILVQLDPVASGFSTTIMLPAQEAQNSISAIYFSQLLETKIACNGFPVSCPSGCSINVLPTTDPYFSFWASSMKNSIGLPVPVVDLALESTLSTIIWIRKLQPNTIVGDIDFGVGDAILDESGEFNSECRLTYSTIIQPSGAAAVVVGNRNVPPYPCEDEDYDRMYQGFNKVVSYLDTDVKSYAANLGLIDLAKVYPTSKAWASCGELALSFFLANTTQVPVTVTSCAKAPGTLAWTQDPCCNTVLQKTLCCEPYDILVNVTTYSIPVDFEARLDQCIYPTCLRYDLEIIKEFTQFTIADSTSPCSSERISLLANPQFSGSPFDECVGRVFTTYCMADPDCAALGALSKCNHTQLSCSIPCVDQSDCDLGSCVDDPVFGRSCVNLSTDDTKQKTAFLDCTLRKVDPYLSLLITQHLNNTKNGGSLVDRFVEEVYEPLCLSESGSPWPVPHGTEEECAADPGYCPWLICPIGGRTAANTPCSVQACLDAAPAPICVFDYTPTYLSVFAGRPAICDIRVEDTLDPQIDFRSDICQEWGGTWAGIDITRYNLFSSCYIANITTESDCYSEICIPGYKGADCASYCYDPSKTDATSCSPGISAGLQQQFYSWMYDSQARGACVIESNGMGSCLSAGYTWQPGRDFLPPILNSESECTNACWTFDSGLRPDIPLDNCSAWRCSSCIKGDEPSCASPEACAASMACDSPIGCKFYENINDFLGFRLACTWTPEGCVADLPAQSCAGSLVSDPNNRIQTLSTYPNEASCESLLICNDETVVNATIGDNQPGLPPGFSLQNASECSKCGGKMQPYYKWKSALWRASQVVVPLTWRKRELSFPSWKVSYSASAYNNMLDNARTLRLNTIFAAELFCEFGIEAELLHSLSCSCASTGYCNTTNLERTSGAPVAQILVCDTISYTYNGSYFTIAVTSSPDTQDKECSQVLIDSIQSEQLEFTQSRVYSSLSLTSETKYAKKSPKFVFNEGGVVVGQVAIDGLSISFAANISSLTSIVLCMPIPTTEIANWELKSDFFEWGIAVASPSDFYFNMRLPFFRENDNLCIELDRDPTVYIVVGLVENWANKTERETWSNTERGLIIFCVVAYLIVDALAIVMFIYRIMADMAYLAITALAAIIVLSSLGTTHLLMSYLGSINDTHLDPLLVDLPTLMLLTCVTIMIVSWMAIVYSGENLDAGSTLMTLMPVIFLISLYIIYVSLSIASSATFYTPIYTCATTDDELNSLSISQKLSLSYKVIFAFWTLLLAIVFLYQSLLIYQMLSQFESLIVVVRKNSIATFTATVALLILAAITIYSTTYDLENTTKLGFTITVLILPSYAIVYLFSVFSSFSSIVDKITGTSPQSPGKSSGQAKK